MTDLDASSVRATLRRAICRGMKERDRLATATYRIALAAIDNAEAIPIGDEQRAGAIELSPVGVGLTDAPRRVLSEQDMMQIVRHEAQILRDTGAFLAQKDPGEARQRHREASLLVALLDGLTHVAGEEPPEQADSGG